MKKILKELLQIKEIIFLTYTSSYTFLDKCSLLKTLIWCYFGVKLKINAKVVTINLMEFKITSYGYLNLLYQIREIFLFSEYRISNIDKPAIILDCGANIGLSVLYFKKCFPTCKILAFEPNPDVYEILKKNIELNYLQGVEAYNVCLTDSISEVDFYLDKKKSGTMQG